MKSALTVRNLAVTLLLVFTVQATIAQPVKKVEKIKEEEVPIAVRQAFINDFGSIPGQGNWSVNFTVIHNGEKAIAQPTSYTFRKGSKSEKVEVRYSPEGKLVAAKGLKKTTAT